jgi:hypothetical protein
VADSGPQFDISLLSDHRIRLDYYPTASPREGKPKGQHEVEIRWGFSDESVTEPTNLTNIAIDTSSPYDIQFSGNVQGRIVYIAMRWRNTRGLPSSWSEIKQTVVP